jgi:hypothetical protein
MAIFKCIDDPTTGPRLRTIGITDDDLVKYIVDRSNELGSDDYALRECDDYALRELLRRKNLHGDDEQFIGAIVAQISIQTQ